MPFEVQFALVFAFASFILFHLKFGSSFATVRPRHATKVKPYYPSAIDVGIQVSPDSDIEWFPTNALDAFVAYLQVKQTQPADLTIHFRDSISRRAIEPVSSPKTGAMNMWQHRPEPRAELIPAL